MSYRDTVDIDENELISNLKDDGYMITDEGKASIVHYNIDIENGNPKDLLVEVKKAWDDTEDLLAITSQGIKQREIHQFLENIFNTVVTPVAPGMFYIFKNDSARENYLYSIQKRPPQKHLSEIENKIRSKEDLLVYLALARFRSENVVSNLPSQIQDSIKENLGNFLKAVSLSKKLLFSTGNKEDLINLCEEAPAGTNDSESFYIHSSAVPDLDPVLRVFIGMAGIFYGDICEADIIKIHKNSIKISFYNYDDFNNKPLPELHSRIKIDLAKQQMNFYNHKSAKNQQLLFFKEKYVLETHPAYKKWKSFSETLRNKGLKKVDEYGPSKQELQKIIDEDFLKNII